jgi:hypothetical protein
MSSRIRVSTTLALVLALPFWVAGPAQAAPISFAFSGTLDSVDSQLNSVFVTGQTFSGNFTYESSAIVSSTQVQGTFFDKPFGSAFYDAVTALSATVQVAPSSLSQQQITFTTIFSSTGGAKNSVVVNHTPAGGALGSDFSSFGVQLFASAGFIGSKGSVGGSPLESVIVFLANHNASVSDAFPPPLPTSLNLSQFDSTGFRLVFTNLGDPDTFFIASGPLSTLAPIPEPTTLLLFGSTIAGIGLARWRQRRRKQEEP